MWQSRFHKGQENVGNGRLAGSVRKETKFSFRRDGDKRAKSTAPPAPRPEPSTPQDVTKSSENHKSWKSKSIWENLSCKKVAFPRVLVSQDKRGMQIHGKVPLCTSSGWGTAQQKVKKEWQQKCSGATLKETRQFGCVFQDMESPRSSSILRKSSTMPKPIWCVRLTKAVLRQANSRDQKPSFNIILPRRTSSAQPERSKKWGSV